MTRKATRRKHYPTDVSMILYVGESVRPLHPDDLAKFRMIELSDIQEFRDGVSGLATLRRTMDMLNLCVTMADSKVGAEAKPACEALQTALLAITARFEKWGKLQATPDEITAMVDVHEYLDLQRGSIALGEYQRLHRLTVNRIRSKHPSSKVLV